MNKGHMGEKALEVLEQEVASLSLLAFRLGVAELDRALQILLDCEGKVVVIGSGKSGIAARKIAATLTSTGTVAVFLHPVDALHGDLGVISAKDVAIAISNSGETDEVKTVVGYLTNRKVPVIAIVGDSRSTLAQKADAALNAGVDKEAGVLPWAPTTSTLAAMVVGDALALALMSIKGFTEQDFALIHPGGTLGKRLTLRVGDLMHPDPIPGLPATASIHEVIEGITRGGLGAVNVVDGERRLLGLITDGDVRRVVQNTEFTSMVHLTARDMMTPDPVRVPPETLAFDALRLMEDRPSQISVLPVVSTEGLCLGLLRVHDVVRAGLR